MVGQFIGWEIVFMRAFADGWYFDNELLIKFSLRLDERIFIFTLVNRREKRSMDAVKILIRQIIKLLY